MVHNLVNYDRLWELREKKGMTKTHLCFLIGRPGYYLRDAKRNDSDIPIEYLEVWAEALHTTVEYLTNKTDVIEETTRTRTLCEKERQLIEAYREASEELQEAALRVLKQK